MKLCFGQGRSRWAAVGCAKLDTFFSRHKKEAVAGLQARMRNTQARAKKGSSNVSNVKLNHNEKAKTSHTISRQQNTTLWQQTIKVALILRSYSSLPFGPEVSRFFYSSCNKKCFSLWRPPPLFLSVVEKEKKGRSTSSVCVYEGCRRISKSNMADANTCQHCQDFSLWMRHTQKDNRSKEWRNEHDNKANTKIECPCNSSALFRHNTTLGSRLVFLLLLPETRFHESDASQRNRKTQLHKAQTINNWNCVLFGALIRL